MTTSPRYSRHARALLVAAMTALVTPACGGGAPNAMTQQERQELEQVVLQHLGHAVGCVVVECVHPKRIRVAQAA